MSSETSLSPSVGISLGLTSLLFEGGDSPAPDPPEPLCFRDLNLDQLVASIVAGREEYALVPFFREPLTSRETVGYRQEVLRDIEEPAIERAITSFAQGMSSVRQRLERADKFYYAVQQQDAFLRSAFNYVATLKELDAALLEAKPRSRGLASFADYLHDYISSSAFEALASESSGVRAGLDGVIYRLHLTGAYVHVRRDVTEEDYAADVVTTFARFRQGRVESHLAKLRTYAEMNHVEAAIAELVAKLYPQEFSALSRFRERHQGFPDGRVASFDREVEFYLAALDFTKRMRAGGLPMCYPEVAESHEAFGAADTFDPALADHLLSNGKSVVVNDFHLEVDERILVVTGPNQGGKTTFARMVGQLIYLASLGLLVPGTQARLPLPDAVLTHFERGENLEDLTGGLEDDLIRMRDILDTATEDTLVIINEVFTSTSLEDAILLSTRVLRQIGDIGCLSVCVTFLDELASLSKSTVSMVSQVDPKDPATRTFKVIRQRADGMAYAEAIAQKHALTYASLKARLAR